MAQWRIIITIMEKNMSFSVSKYLLLLMFIPVFVSCSSVPENLDMSAKGAQMARLGDKMQEKGETGTAIDFYRRSLRKAPDNFQAITGLAKAFQKWGNRAAALEVYEKGVEVRPNDAKIRSLYAKMLLKLDLAMQAKKQYEIALDLDPNNLEARTYYGVSLDYLGKHKLAQKQYNKVLDKDEDNLTAINNLSYSYILSSRPDKAIRLLEPELHNPKAKKALRQNLALAYGISGMEDDAMRVALMDFSKEKAKENLKYYRLKRAEMQINTTPYAIVGSYATKAMALSQIKKLRRRASKVAGRYKPVIIPEVSAPGGTPRFSVRMMGCSRPSDISKLCKTLLRYGLPCSAKK